MTKEVIILGSNGFIGSRLLKNCSMKTSYEVRGYSREECDLLSLDSINSALPSVTSDYVIIMTSSITRLKDNTYNSMIKNIAMAENIGRFIKERLVGQFIFLSTVDVYGFVKSKINEKLPPDPKDYYAISKLTSEFILRKYCSESNIPLLILRLSGIYGPGDEGKSTINRLFRSAVEKNKVTIWGDGTDKRDYVYVDDIYKIINEAIMKKSNRTINVATGRSYSILQIIDMIKSLSLYKFQVEFRSKASNGEKRIEDMIFDCSLLMEEFPNLQLTELKEGISRYMSHSLGRV